MTIYKMQNIWDKLEEIQFLVTEQKKKMYSFFYVCSCALQAWVLCQVRRLISELKADATQGSTCSRPIGIKHFSCPTCTTATVIHQCEAKLALENILII